MSKTTEGRFDFPVEDHEGFPLISDIDKTGEPMTATPEAEHLYSLKDIIALVQNFGATDELKKAYTYVFHLAYQLKDSPFRDVIILSPRLHVRMLKAFTPGSSPFKPNPDTDKRRILGEESGTRELVELVMYPEEKLADRLQFASLVYSASSKDTHRYRSDGPFGNFAAPHELRFEGTYFFNGTYEDGRLAGYRVPIEQALQDDELATGVTFGQDSMGALLRHIHREPASCEEALTELKRLGEELEIDPNTLETLCRAVQDFATYVKSEPKTDTERYEEIGRCFTTPHTFVDFCRSWYGIKVNNAFYEQSIYGTPTFFHQVNLFGRKLVIDWTARQYGRGTPYPFIYKADDPNVRASCGKLHGRWVADTKPEST